METYADSILLIPWLIWLLSYLWRLGRLGSQGWIVVGLRDLGRCGRWCASTMFLEYILSHPYPSSVVLMLC